MLKAEILAKLKNTKMLDDVELTEFVPTGSYALNKIISGRYNGGIPRGAITQIRGESSTGKTLFVTSIFREAQKLGYICKLLDAENAFNKEFAVKVGLDPSNLLYSCPEYLEEAFDDVENTVAAIRESDKKTPIVIAIDSLPVLPIKKEMDKENYESTEMEGAQRAKIIGSCLRKLNPLLRANDVTLVVINQIRSKVGVIYGSPETNAAGGKSLEFYLAVDLKTVSNKTSDVIKDENDTPTGIRGRVDCKKNKCSIPFQNCHFMVVFDSGLDPYEGLIDLMAADKTIIKAPNGRCQIGETKFTSKEFINLINDKNNRDFDIIRQKLNIN
tara:strand:- start:12965 stop:13951 length:987 start_codon:yes stop_codon:yes gene_type:complete